MYTQDHVQAIRNQLKRRYTAFIVAAVLIVAMIIATVIIRNEKVTNICTIVGFGGLIFAWDRLITPLRKYADHLMDCTEGITHEVEVLYDSISPDLSVVEGVRFFAMHTLEQKGDKQFDRLFYWDAELPKPDYEPGQRIKVTYHDRQIANIEAI